MKSKKLFSAMANHKIIMALPVMFIFLLPVTSQQTAPARVTATSDSIYVLVDQMPSFPGGDIAMMNFINSNIIYPETASKNGIQGRVYLRFCVTDMGKVNQVKILKGVDPALDAEAMRVVALLPAFTPGKLKGKSVSVWYQLPITFALK